MHVIARAFSAQKLGNAEADYEDAFEPRRPVDATCERFRAAVADGATETSYSGLWARLLVHAYAGSRPYLENVEPARWAGALHRLQARWQRIINTAQLPWYAEEKARMGAFSSLLGLSLADGDGQRGAWRAVAVGDSCLFQVRDGQLIRAFPYRSSEDFTNRPVLVSSVAAQNHDLAEHVLGDAGEWETDDAFYLMTDALACWFLKAHEDGERPWCVLRDLDTADESRPFGDWVDGLRASQAMRNDDVTLLRVDVVDAARPRPEG
jgi:hypothetical protein